MQLFQKLTNTAIPVSSGTHFKGAQSFQGDGSIRSGMTNDLNHIFLHANLYRFPLIICFVIHSISQPLFDCLVGIIEKSVRLCFPGNFNDLLRNYGIPYIAQRHAKLLMQRSGKGLFYDFIASLPFGKLHHIYCCIGEEFLRL